jgi:hypothetical protein
MVPGKSMDVYYEQTPNAASASPGNVVLVPGGQKPSGGNYQKANIPAWFRSDGIIYIVEPGAPIQLDPSEVQSTGMQTENHTVFKASGDTSSQPTYYLKVKSNPDYYVAYDPPS